MNIKFKNQEIEQICTDRIACQKSYSKKTFDRICACLETLTATNNLNILIYGKILGCHRLWKKRRGQIAMVLDGPYRLVFTEGKNHLEVIIEEVIDYHPNHKR